MFPEAERCMPIRRRLSPLVSNAHGQRALWIGIRNRGHLQSERRWPLRWSAVTLDGFGSFAQDYQEGAQIPAMIE
jgi:hypothetical protein